MTPMKQPRIIALVYPSESAFVSAFVPAIYAGEERNVFNELSQFSANLLAASGKKRC